MKGLLAHLFLQFGVVLLLQLFFWGFQDSFRLTDLLPLSMHLFLLPPDVRLDGVQVLVRLAYSCFLDHKLSSSSLVRLIHVQ